LLEWKEKFPHPRSLPCWCLKPYLIHSSICQTRIKINKSTTGEEDEEKQEKEKEATGRPPPPSLASSFSDTKTLR
jgi:hypothetical protein